MIIFPFVSLLPQLFLFSHILYLHSITMTCLPYIFFRPYSEYKFLLLFYNLLLCLLLIFLFVSFLSSLLLFSHILYLHSITMTCLPYIFFRPYPEDKFLLLFQKLLLGQLLVVVL